MTPARSLKTLLLVLALCCTMAPAAESARYYASAPSLRPLFRPVVAKARQSTVLVRCDGEPTALGTIIEADGLILTKASELEGQLTCQLPDGRDLEAKLIASMPEYDLATLKIDARGLVPVRWGDASKLAVGRWIATVSPSELPLAVGVISVGRRNISSRDVVLGVMLGEDHPDGVPVLSAAPGSGAEKAGIRAGDVILGINGTVTADREALIGEIGRHRAGDEVVLRVLRGNAGYELPATLGQRPSTGLSRSEVMNRMGGELSERKSGFPSAIQHDTVLKPSECGGPVVDIDGNVIGINIARAGRTESYALPADVVVEAIAKLKTR